MDGSRYICGNGDKFIEFDCVYWLGVQSRECFSVGVEGYDRELYWNAQPYSPSDPLW